jgi:hypothetical protein
MNIGAEHINIMRTPTEIRNLIEELRLKNIKNHEILREVCKLCEPYKRPGPLPGTLTPLPNGATQEWVQQLRTEHFQTPIIKLDMLSEDALDALELILLERLEDDSRRTR